MCIIAWWHHTFPVFCEVHFTALPCGPRSLKVSFPIAIYRSTSDPLQQTVQASTLAKGLGESYRADPLIQLSVMQWLLFHVQTPALMTLSICWPYLALATSVVLKLPIMKSLLSRRLSGGNGQHHVLSCISMEMVVVTQRKQLVNVWCSLEFYCACAELWNMSIKGGGEKSRCYRIGSNNSCFKK